MKEQRPAQALRQTLTPWLSRGMLSPAIALMESRFADPDCADERRRTAAVRQLYDLMAHYALDGAADTSRQSVATRIHNAVLDIVDLYDRRTLVDDNNSISLYASKARTFRMSAQPPLSDVAAALENDLADRSVAEIFSPGRVDSAVLRRMKDNLALFFHRLWTAHPLSPDDTAALRALAESKAPDMKILRQLSVGALLLGELAWHDDERLSALTAYYTALSDDEPATALKALTALALAVMFHTPERRRWRDRLASQLASLSARPTFSRDLRNVVLQIARARDTDRVTRRMTSDIIPSLLRFKTDKLKFDIEADLEALEENPEWAGSVENLAKLQEEGADVMMSTFAPLKSLPFFNDIHTWFLPFDRAVMPDTISLDPKILEMITATPALCDSDKYCMALALSNMPPEISAQMGEKLGAEFEGYAEAAREAGPAADTDREAAVRNYVRSLHRFFSLFRRKSEFSNPFVQEFTPGALRVFDPLDAVTGFAAITTEAADFLFSKGYYDQALPLYRSLGDNPTDVDLLEKTAYCLQQTGEHALALDLYLRADALGRPGRWRLRRIAACQRALGRYNDAVATLQRLMDMTPEPSAKQVLVLANHLVMAERREEAMPLYFRAEYLDPSMAEALRSIAWLSLLEASIDRASAYVEKIFALPGEPKPQDHINRAHVSLLRGRPREAADSLRRAFRAMNTDARTFADTVDNDFRQLADVGLDPLVAAIALSEAISDK